MIRQAGGEMLPRGSIKSESFVLFFLISSKAIAMRTLERLAGEGNGQGSAADQGRARGDGRPGGGALQVLRGGARQESPYIRR